MAWLTKTSTALHKGPAKQGQKGELGPGGEGGVTSSKEINKESPEFQDRAKGKRTNLSQNKN